MRILRLSEHDLPVTSPGANAVMDFSGLKTTVVTVESDLVKEGRPTTGYGFSSIGRWSATGLLVDRFFPRLRNADPAALLDETGLIDPFACARVAMANEKQGGHGERAYALGALDMALWDLRSKAEDVPLWRLLADRFRGGVVDDYVAVYAAGGYYGSANPARAIAEEMRRYRDLGYASAKIKIGGASLADDIRRIEAAADVFGSPDAVAVDANGRFGLADALVYAEALEDIGVRWFEEPGDPLDYRLHAVVAESVDLPLAAGENIFASAEARNLMRHAGLRPGRDILQFDCSLSYGLPDYMRTLGLIDRHGWSRRSVHPHGGHQMSLNLAAGLGLGGNESYPGVFQPLGGFADDIAIEDGKVRLHDTPGIGLELKQNLWQALKDIGVA